MRTLVLATIYDRAIDKFYFLKSYDSVGRQYYIRPFGGHMQNGEVAEETLRRELLEELGLSIEGPLKFMRQFVLDSFLGRRVKPKNVILFNLEISSQILKPRRIQEGEHYLGEGIWLDQKVHGSFYDMHCIYKKEP